MRILGFWIGGGLCVVVGHGLGAGRPALGLSLAVLAAGAAAVAMARASSARGRPWLILAVFALLAGRGAWTAEWSGSTPWLGPRGAAHGVRTLIVERASHPGPRCRVRVRSAGVPLWLRAPASACPLSAGQRIRVRADRLRLHVEPELPGAPSPAALARSRGAVAGATVDRIWSGGGDPSVYWSWVAEQRQRAWSLSRGDDAKSFVVAAGLGVRSALAPADRSALRRAGLGHLVAVSGLHVGLAAWALLALSMRVGARIGAGTWGVAACWIPLWGYVLLTGASPPAVRAAVMAMGVGLGGGLGRPHHGPVLLAVTSVGMLVVRPAWAFDPGFQLSVAAMATLTRAPTDEGMLRQTWRVTWAVLPVSLWHFGQAGAWGIVANLIAVPVFTLWVLPLGLLGWLVVPWLGAAALVPASWGARPILALARWLADWPAPSQLAIASAAGLAVVLGLVVGRRDRDGRLRPGWSWIPPLPVAVLVLVAIAWPRRGVAPAGELWVLGSPAAPAVVTRSPTGSTACIHSVAVSPSRWVPLLDAMGISAAGWAHPGPRAPHESALEQTLRTRDRWVDAPSDCPAAPAPDVTRRVLEHCRRHAATRHAMAVVGEGSVDCFVRGRWRRLGGSNLLDSPAPEGS